MSGSINEIWHNKQKSWLKPVDIPELKKDESLVKTAYSMVSLGTEKTVLTQNLPDTMAGQMAIPYMKGSLIDTFTYGYSAVGEVIKGDEFWEGKNVHLMHPHQDYMVVSLADLVEIPAGIDLKSATLASNMETAINAIWDAEVSLGDRVLIFGYGLIGGLIATIIRHMIGIQVEVFEMNANRQKLHVSHGISIKSLDEYDVVFNATSNESALQEALTLTRQEGKVIELSWYGNRDISLQLGADFHYGRKQIISSQVSQIPYKKQPLWNYRKRKQLVFDLLANLDFTHLLTDEVDFRDTPKFYDRLRNDKIKNLSTIICY
jgi:threonine dehydrogenase-like Zn-dependent dehydrogenase